MLLVDQRAIERKGGVWTVRSELRRQLVEVARKAYDTGLVTGTSGNMSVRDPDSGHILITPSGVEYHAMTPDQMVLVDVNGHVVEGKLVPSSETPMHTAVYRMRPDVQAVVHTHSRFATVFSCLRRPIPAVHYLIALMGTEIPVADYATYGTDELARSAVAAMGTDHRAVLLQNHGVLAVGKHIQEAYNIAAVVEYIADVYYHSLTIGQPVVLPDDEVHRVAEKFKTYGQVASRDRA